MSLLSRVVTSSILGKHYKYFFVFGFLIILSSIIIYQVTKNMQISLLIPGSIAVMIFLYGIYLGEKNAEDEEKFAKSTQERYKELGNKIEVEANKCMSCLRYLAENENTCLDCGFTNKIKEMI